MIEQPSRTRLLALAVALGAPGLVTLLALAAPLSPVIPALLYVVAIAAAALVGGVVVGLVAAIASFIPFNYFFSPPSHGFSFDHWVDAVALVIFLAVAAGAGEFVSRERRARVAERAARREAEEATSRTSRLEAVSRGLSEALTPQSVLGTVLTHGVEAAGARAGVIALVDDSGMIELLAQQGYASGRFDAWRRFGVDDPTPMSEAIRTGEPIFLEDTTEHTERYPLLAGNEGLSHALVCLPLVFEGKPIGALSLGFNEVQVFDQERRELKIALAHQTAQALQRTKLLEAQQQLRDRLSFLAEASELLGSSLDYERTLEQLAQICVPNLADWCSIDMVGEDGELERLTVAHQDPLKVEWAKSLQERYPPSRDDPYGVVNVIRTGEPEFFPELSDDFLVEAAQGDQELLEIILELGLQSSICVPLVARGRTIGALSLVAAESGRHYEQLDLEQAQELARRAASAVDNALLYREAEKRAEAAMALQYVREAVVLLDRGGIVRYWNDAAERLFGVGEDLVLHRLADEAVPGWLPVAGAEPGIALPLDLPAGERWVVVSSVGFEEGYVVALRDVSDEHALEKARSDFVATASHELRTPLAAIYGASRTLLREDVELAPADSKMLLQAIANESERLAHIVDQMVLAGQLGAGSMQLVRDACNLPALVEDVAGSARLRLPPGTDVVTEGPEPFPSVAADEPKLRQVLMNLVDNAIKYSPGGGTVGVRWSRNGAHARIDVADEGLGIPSDSHERIFEKFYRLDPALTRGVGGSGLGLYICRELVQRMDGRIWVSSANGNGSTFSVELPLA